MPVLRILEISYCEILETLPDLLQTMLVQELVITSCPILDERCREKVGEAWHLILFLNFFLNLIQNIKRLLLFLKKKKS